MENVPSLVSLGVPSRASLTRTRACDVGVLGTVHAYDPVVEEILPTIVCQGADEPILYSIFTLLKLFAVHVMFLTVLNCQFSPPFGEMSPTA
jgi:hypothetical protein